MATIEDYIRQAATARGIDPNIAVRVAQSEGGLSSLNAQSSVLKNGIQEPSFGPFQLLVGGSGTGFPSGLGNSFISQTGMNPADASAGYAGIDFALDTAAKDGWRQWYGADAAGISRWDGITRGFVPVSGTGASGIAGGGDISADGEMLSPYEQAVAGNGSTHVPVYYDAPAGSGAGQGTKADAGSPGAAGSIPQAIVSAGNQVSKATVSGANTQADATKTAAQTEAKSDADLQAQAQSWTGDWALRIFLFVVGAIFIAAGLYMFGGKSILPAPIKAALA